LDDPSAELGTLLGEAFALLPDEAALRRRAPERPAARTD
jgi:hypothetical protein